MRAADGTLASQGRREFAARALQIAPSLASNWFVGGSDIEERITKVYEHRNECVHGDLPFPEVYEETSKDKATAGAVQAEYLAEAVARGALLAVLSKPACFVHFKDRATLKDAWREGLVP